MKRIVIILLSVFVVSCSNIPKDVDYKVRKTVEQPQFNKRILEVELNKKVDFEVLNELASHYRTVNADVRILMINYYIKGQVEKSAWAISHYTPELQMEVLGGSKDSKVKMPDIPAEIGEVSRYSESVFGVNRTIILRKDSKAMFMKSVYQDGSFDEVKLLERVVAGEKRLYSRFKEPSRYYIIKDDKLLDYEAGKLLITLQPI
jgi:hypothetical protein